MCVGGTGEQGGKTHAMKGEVGWREWGKGVQGTGRRGQGEFEGRRGGTATGRRRGQGRGDQQEVSKRGSRKRPTKAKYE